MDSQVRATDVADYILHKRGMMSALKLQKLAYYCQAWSLVWDDAPLFSDRIEAWANGPVVPALYDRHRGQFQVTASMMRGDQSKLTDGQRATIDAVLEAYADKSPQWLSDQTHSEAPWKQARAGVAPGERCNNEISLRSMQDFYANLG